MLYERSPCSGRGRSPYDKVRKECAIYAWYAFGGLCLAFLLPVSAWAAPPTIRVDADLLHELRARQALLRDRDVAPLNLGVRVHDHVAILWGPVPSAALQRRAVEVLKQLPELMEVRDELHVDATLQAHAAVAPLPPPRPPAMPDGPRASAPSPGLLMKHRAASSKSSPSPVGNPQWRPGDEEGPLLPAIAIPRPSTAAVDDLGPGDWLIESATRLQRSEPRFHGLRVQVRGKIVRLDGSVEQWSDAHDLAQRIGRLAGVERVVLGDIQTASRSP
jgi:BON domain